MYELVEKHRTYLPHLQEEGQVIHLTWRLDGTLPQQTMDLIKEMKAVISEAQNKANAGSRSALLDDYYQKLEIYDEQLGNHQPTGTDLSQPEIAAVLTGAMRFYHDSLYTLYAYCVMPNHVHLLLQPLPQPRGEFARMSEIVRRIKGYTGYRINALIGNRNPFWHPDYFDRAIRNELDLFYTIQYILNNPLKAGLADEQEQWPYSYLNPNLSR